MDEVHKGHRQRTLERLESGESSLQDHELFEILLYSAIPRKNTNPLAHRLIEAFGSIDGVFHATYQQLLTVEGVGPSTAAYLRCIAIINERMRFNESQFPKKFNFEAYAPFLTGRLGGLTREVVEVFALDSSERITSSKRFTSKSTEMASVDINELALFLAANRPHGIVIAHNHPNRSSKNSVSDDEFTAKAEMLCAMHNVKLYDHMIVGCDNVYSYFLHGRLEVFQSALSVEKMIKEYTNLEKSKRTD